MADFKTINTRIALRTGDFAYWTTGAGKDIELIKGEVCVCTVAVADNQATTAPTVLFKVCDTTGKKFADLKWTSALAADVYEWAKEAALYHTTTATTATEGGKTYTGNALTKVEWDASLNNGKGGLKFTKEVQFATKAELDAAIAAFGGDLSNITDTDTRYLFSTNGDKLVVKKVLYTNGVAGAEESVGEYEFLSAGEVQTMLASYYTKTEVDGLLNGYKKTQTAIGAQNYSGATVIKSVSQDAQGVINVATRDLTPADIGAQPAGNYQPAGDYQPAGNYKTKQTAVAAQNLSVDTRDLTPGDLGLSGAMHFAGIKDALPTTGNDGDVVLVGGKEYVWANSKWNELGDEGSHALKTVKVTANEGLTGGGTLAADMTVGIAAGGVTTAKIADDAVTADKIADAVNTDIAKGVAAHGWGNHASAGYAKNADLTKVINGTTPVAKATDADHADNADTADYATEAGDAEKLGGQLPSYYAPVGATTDAATANTVYGAKKHAEEYATKQAAAVLSEAQGYTDGAINGLHAVAKSGSIYDLAEAEEENGVKYIILDCNW